MSGRLLIALAALVSMGRIEVTWGQATESAESLPEIVVEGARLETAKTLGAASSKPSKEPSSVSSETEAAQQGGGTSDEGAVSGPAPESEGPASDTLEGTPIERVGSAVTVVTGKQLEAQEIRTAAEALRSLPGVHVNRSNGVTGLTQVRIRGAEANHTLVMIDGVEANDATNGEFDFSDLSTDDIERIEVIRGGQSSIYGSGAIGGVINIITRSGKGPLTFRALAEAGSFATREGGGSVSAGNDQIWGRMAFTKRETGGFNIAPTGPENDSGELATFVFKGGARIMEGLTLDGVMRHTNKAGDRDTEGAVLGQLQEQTDDPAEFNHETWLQGLSLRWDTLGGMLSQTVRATRNETHRTDNSPTFFFRSDFLGETISYAYTGTLRFGDPAHDSFANTFTWLVEDEKDRFTPDSVSFDPFFPSQDDGFARVRNRLSYAGEWTGDIANRVTLTAGIRHDDNDTFEDFTTWRTTATARLPELGLRPHASAGTGVKAPTMFEQYGTIPRFFTPNPELKPEESFGWDAGLELATRDRRYVLDVTYFDADLENQIDGFAPGPNFTFTAVNREGVSHRSGIEVAGSAEIITGLTLSGSYTYLDATTPEGLEEVRRPHNAARADLTYVFDGGKGTLNVGAIYNGEMDDPVRRVTGFFLFGVPILVAERFTLDDYLVVNVAASYEIAKGVELYGRVENAFDEDYQEVFGFETAGVAAYGGVRFRLVEEQTRAWSQGR
jgi:vitamin B12 transporter